jgi:S1-C subfamily serine protease
VRRSDRLLRLQRPSNLEDAKRAPKPEHSASETLSRVEATVGNIDGPSYPITPTRHATTEQEHGVMLLTASVLITATLAAATAQAPAAQHVAYDYSALYEALNPSIVKIHADSGSGSGFLASGEGLVATNHHVVRNSRYLAVQFADGRKVLAHVVVLDPQHDVAILKVNAGVVGALKPLHFCRRNESPK